MPRKCSTPTDWCFLNLLDFIPLKHTWVQLIDWRLSIVFAAGAIQLVERQLHDGVLAAAAGAVVATGVTPAKLNPLLRPLMSVVQRHPQVGAHFASPLQGP